MVSNPFADGIAVQVDSDVSGFNSGISHAISRLGDFRLAAAAAGGAVAALAGGALVEATRAAADFETALVEVEKVTDPETANRMSDAIMEMANVIPLTHDELADLTAQAGRFGIRGEENLRRFVEATAKMATATDLSASEAGESFARLSTLMEVPVEDVDKLGAAINELSNNAATSSSEIVDSMLRSGGALTQMGMKSTEIIALSGTLNEVSESAERAGTRLRSIAQEMVDPRKVSDLAAALGMTVDEFKSMRSESPLELIRMMASEMDRGGEKADALNSTLGRAARQGLSALAQNLDGLDSALGHTNGQFENATSLQREFEAATQTFHTQVQLLRNRITGLGISIGNKLLPYVTKAVKWFSTIVDRLSAVNKATDGWAATLTLLTGLIGGTIVAVGSLISVFGGTSAILAPLIAGFATLGAAVGALVSPFGLAVAAVALLGLAVSRNFGGIRDDVNQVVNLLRDTFVAWMVRIRRIVTEVMTTISRIWSQRSGEVEARIRTLSNVISGDLGGTIQWLRRVVSNALDRIYVLWVKYGDQIVNIAIDGILLGLDALILGIRTLKNIVNTVWGAIMSIWNTYASSITNATRSTLGEILIEFRQTFNLIRQRVDVVMKILRDIFNWFIVTVWPMLQRFLGRVSDLWHQHMGGPDGILAEAQQVFNTLWVNVIRPTLNLIQWLFGKVTQAIRIIWDVFGDDILLIARGMIDTLLPIIETGFDLLLTTINVILDLLQGDWEGAWNHITSFFQRTWDRIVEWTQTAGKDLLTGAFNIVIKAVKGIFNAFWDWLIGNSFFPDLIGAVAGWISGTGKKLVGDAWGKVVGAIESKLNSINASGIMSTLSSVISKANTAISRAAKAARDRVSSTFNNAVDRVTNRDSSSSSSGGAGGYRGSGRSSGGTSAGVGFSVMQSGGIVPAHVGEMAALLHGPEAVIPLDRLDEFTGGGGPTVGEVHIYANDRQGGREAGKAFVKELRSGNF